MKPFILFSVILGAIFTFSAQAGVVEDRKANFKNNVTILKAIQGQIQAGDFDRSQLADSVLRTGLVRYLTFFQKDLKAKGR